MKKLGVVLMAILFFSCNKNVTDKVTTQGTSVASTSGIGGFPMTSVNDRAIAFDYDHSGKRDHILVYQPGANTVKIFANTGTVAAPVYTAVFSSTTGIGGYQLTQACPTVQDIPLDLGSDKIIAYDYDNSGKMDHLLCYRSGSGLCTILANSGGVFTPVFSSSGGIAGYDLRGVSDKIIAFDGDNTGHNNDLICYRPGYGFIWFIRRSGSNFVAYQTGNGGVGGYNLADQRDQIIGINFQSVTGSLDCLALYRPGTGIFWTLQRPTGVWTPRVKITSGGLPGFDLSLSQDRIFTYDYQQANGFESNLFCYRPGGGIWAVEVLIINNNIPNYYHVTGCNCFLGSFGFSYNPTASDGWVADRGFAFDTQSNGQMSGVAFFDGGPNVFDVFNSSLTQIY